MTRKQITEIVGVKQLSNEPKGQIMTIWHKFEVCKDKTSSNFLTIFSYKSKNENQLK